MRLIDMERTEAHRLPRVVLNERRRAVKLRLSGATIAETMAQCELGRSAIIRAMQAYQRGGWKAVPVPIVGRPMGSGRLLNAEQEKNIQQWIADRTPDQLKLAYALWTRQAVCDRDDAKASIKRQFPSRCSKKWLRSSRPCFSQSSTNASTSGRTGSIRSQARLSR